MAKKPKHKTQKHCYNKLNKGFKNVPHQKSFFKKWDWGLVVENGSSILAPVLQSRARKEQISSISDTGSMVPGRESLRSLMKWGSSGPSSALNKYLLKEWRAFRLLPWQHLVPNKREAFAVMVHRVCSPLQMLGSVISTQWLVLCVFSYDIVNFKLQPKLYQKWLRPI